MSIESDVTESGKSDVESMLVLQNANQFLSKEHSHKFLENDWMDEVRITEEINKPVFVNEPLYAQQESNEEKDYQSYNSLEIDSSTSSSLDSFEIDASEKHSMAKIEPKYEHKESLTEKARPKKSRPHAKSGYLLNIDQLVIYNQENTFKGSFDTKGGIGWNDYAKALYASRLLSVKLRYWWNGLLDNGPSTPIDKNHKIVKDLDMGREYVYSARFGDWDEDYKKPTISNCTFAEIKNLLGYKLQK